MGTTSERDPYWNHSTHYHRHLTGLVDPSTVRALDVGCGEGLLTRRLRSAGVDRVLGLDVDPAQVTRARALADDPYLEYITGDLLDTGIAALSVPFDLVTCVATLHHVDPHQGLRRLRALVAPGGTLGVVGLTHPRTLGDWLVSGAGVPAAALARRRRGTWEHSSPIAEVTTSPAQLRAAVREVLPGAVLRRRLYWRYTLVWRNAG